MAAISPGSKLSHFEILEKLGEGGMGVVYKARDLRLERLVAIKVLPEQASADADREVRFEQEAKAASALNHPNIITLHEIDRAGDAMFIAMEFVDGKTLDEAISRKGMRVSEALKYAGRFRRRETAAAGRRLRGDISDRVARREMDLFHLAALREFRGLARALCRRYARARHDKRRRPRVRIRRRQDSFLHEVGCFLAAFCPTGGGRPATASAPMG
jgi:Protein kinase domain